MRLVSLHHYGFQVVGFDCEWVFWGQRLPVALIQIATYDGLCVLVRIFQMTESIPLSLKKFLADKRFVYADYFGRNLVCKQHRCRPACASAQSDQHLCYSLFGKYHR